LIFGFILGVLFAATLDAGVLSDTEYDDAYGRMSYLTIVFGFETINQVPTHSLRVCRVEFYDADNQHVFTFRYPATPEPAQAVFFVTRDVVSDHKTATLRFDAEGCSLPAVAT
jgi:hypothetical protein